MQLGWSVWWDRRLTPGDKFETTIERAIADSRCMLVAWSRASIESRWVRAEVEAGAERGLLVPFLIDDVTPPFLYRGIHTARLIDWNGDSSHPEFQSLIAALSAKVGPPPNVVLPKPERPAPASPARPTPASSPPVVQPTARPAGLTVLATLNIVFSALNLLCYVGFCAALAKNPKPSELTAEELNDLNDFLVGGFIGTTLSIIAAVGYLREQRMGRWMGNAYAVVVILFALILLSSTGVALLQLIYPIVTLILINGRYKARLIK